MEKREGRLQRSLLCGAKEKHMANILIIGGITYNDLVYLDTFPKPAPQTIFSKHHHSTIGGTGAGKALNLNRLKHDVTLHGLIGRDMQGEYIHKLFAAEGIRFAKVIDPRGTERHINLMDAAGDRISIYVNYATFEPMIDTDSVRPLIGEADLVALNIINYGRHLIPAIQAAGKPIWVDIHDYDGAAAYHQPFIDAANVLFMSSDQLPDYTAFMRRMISAGKELVICTHGKDGATGLTRGGVWGTVPAIDTKLVDSNGAGDSFFSGVLHGYLQGHSLQTCMELGTVAAALCVGSRELFSPELSPARLETLHEEYFVAEGRE
jgi:sugar/nucleoside kinase (ribokinase family)